MSNPIPDSARLPGAVRHLRDLRSGLAVSVVTAAAAWLMLSSGLTSVLNENKPFAAALISGGNGVTRTQIERRKSPPTGQPAPVADQKTTARLREIAVDTLRAEPLNVEAIRQLARAAQQTGDNERAAKLLAEIYRRSFRDLDATGQLFTQSLVKPDLANALRYADALLRAQPDLFHAMLPVLSAIADQPEASPALIAIMNTRPPWRPSFFEEYGTSVKNDQSYLQLYFALKDTPGSLSPAEVQSFLRNLLGRDRVDMALSIWLASLPGEKLSNLPLLYNGDFELPVNDAPFNWTVSNPSGATVQIADIPGGMGSKGLSIEFANRRAEFQHVQQTVALTPGRYRLSGRYKSDDFRNSRGMVWRIFCGYAAPRMIAETPRLMNDAPAWQAFDVSFEVPATQCASQLVRLDLAARIPVEQMASGRIWFDKLAIEKAP